MITYKASFFLLLSTLSLNANHDNAISNLVEISYFDQAHLQSNLSPKEKDNQETLYYQTYTAQPLPVLQSMKKRILLDLDALYYVERGDREKIEQALRERLVLIESALACYDPPQEIACEQSLIGSILIEATIITAIIGVGAFMYSSGDSQDNPPPSN